MRELRCCDFCDGDAVGTFAVVPPELEPSEDEQRRVVLCGECRDRLRTLLEPLLARAGDDGADGRPRSGANESGSDDAESDTDDVGNDTVVATANESTAARTRTSSPTATVSEPDDDRPDGADTDTDDGDALDDGSRSRGRVVDGVTIGQASDESDDGATAAASDRSPKAYGKVLRLLENRAFPMDRREAQQLAAGAYDLEQHEVSAIVDRAIERGEFVEKRDELRRPDD